MGLVLGFIGGGGSILTVPILVYLFHIEPIVATAYSLFIVGFTSLVGSFSHIKQGNIHWIAALVFGIPSVITVFLTRMYLLPAIPSTLLHLNGLVITKSIALLLLFAIIMLMASYSMIRQGTAAPPTNPHSPQQPAYNYPIILLEGAIVGIVTGLVGAGGGFLIIPALVLFAKIPMKQAVGTSLLIIAAKSLIGFMGDVGTSTTIQWQFLGIFSAIATVGILAGSYLSQFVSNERLKPIFGWFVLIMGIYILIKELFFHT